MMAVWLDNVILNSEVFGDEVLKISATHFEMVHWGKKHVHVYKEVRQYGKYHIYFWKNWNTKYLHRGVWPTAHFLHPQYCLYLHSVLLNKIDLNSLTPTPSSA